MNGVEFLRTARGKDADQIDDDFGVVDRGIDGRRIPQIGLDRHDLPNPPKRLQVPREIIASQLQQRAFRFQQ